MNTTLVKYWALSTLILVMVPSPVALAGGWQSAESIQDLENPLASDLAAKLASELKAEQSTVIFIDMHACRGPEGFACERFQATFQRALLDKRIAFLPEAQSNEVRAKIANEHLYQNESGHVDVAKAVAMGSQEAFSAFVTVNVSTADNKILADAL